MLSLFIPPGLFRCRFHAQNYLQEKGSPGIQTEKIAPVPTPGTTISLAQLKESEMKLRHLKIGKRKTLLYTFTKDFNNNKLKGKSISLNGLRTQKQKRKKESNR